MPSLPRAPNRPLRGSPGFVNTVHPVDDLRTRIARAAQDLFLAGGVEAVSMRKVAESVGVTAPAIYRHFRDKEDLLDEIIRSGLAILDDYLRPAFDAATPEARLVRLIDRYLDFALEQPRYFDFAFLVPSRSISPMSDEIARQGMETFGFALEQVGLCMAQGMFKKDDPVETAILIWAEVHGLVTLFKMKRFGPDEEEFRRVYRGAVDRLLRGLRT